MEELLNYIGLSFTASKFLPYFLIVFLGLFFSKLLYRHISASKIIRILFITLITILPFGIYFAIHPIFEGEISNEGINIKNNLDLPKNKDLLIIALADCPYCIQSQETIKLIHEKNKKIKAEYLIVNGTKQDSIRYARMLNGFASCRTMKNSIPLLQSIQGHFPSFILVRKGKLNKVWSNNTFSVRAWDEVASCIE
ncbi:MAG: hypothetical protein EBS12_01650 [Flavobacteriia bacterium]|jgi:hypothetical protein|nr:hypothetical protein [Flavobacteriia bacterium]